MNMRRTVRGTLGLLVAAAFLANAFFVAAAGFRSRPALASGHSYDLEYHIPRDGVKHIRLKPVTSPASWNGYSITLKFKNASGDAVAEFAITLPSLDGTQKLVANTAYGKVYASLVGGWVYLDVYQGLAWSQVYATPGWETAQIPGTLYTSIYLDLEVKPPTPTGPSGGGAVTPPPTTGSVTEQGGKVTSSDGKVEADFPEGSLPVKGTEKATVAMSTPAASDEAIVVAEQEAGKPSILHSIEIEVKVGDKPVTRFEKPVTLRVRVPFCGERTGLYYFDSALRAIVPLKAACADDRTIKVEISHLTVFLAMTDADGRFVDMIDHWAAAHVGKLARKRVVKGVGGHRFEPDRQVTRAEVAKMLVLAAGVPGKVSEDGELAGHWARDFVATARAAGAVTGYPDGSFRADRSVTRAELATMVARQLGLAEKPAAMRDATRHWASGWIGALADKGVLAGYPDGTFRPDAPVSRAEAAKVLAKAFGWD